jgi:hypothetical protein
MSVDRRSFAKLSAWDCLSTMEQESGSSLLRSSTLVKASPVELPAPVDDLKDGEFSPRGPVILSTNQTHVGNWMGSLTETHSFLWHVLDDHNGTDGMS